MKRWLLYLICIFSILVLNVLYVEYQFFVLLMLVIAVPLISWLLFIFSTVGLKVYMQLPQSIVSLGEEVVIRIKAVNKRFMFVGKQSYIIGMHYSNTEQAQAETLKVTADLESVEVSLIDFKPEHCGIVEITVKKVYLQDYLGIFRASRDYNGKCELAVMPEQVLSSKVKSYAERQQEYSIISGCEEDSEVVDWREFQPGDKLNRIHWNMSVKVDEMIVKQYGSRGDIKYVLLADLTQLKKENFRDILDKIYAAVYSIGNMYLENGFEVLILAWNEESAFVESYESGSTQELDRAMCGLMQIKCSINAGENVVDKYLKGEYLQYRAVFVTAKNYNINQIQVVNVMEANLQEIVDNLWQKI